MLHYEINGKGQEVLVLLHGFMENNTIWKRMEGLLLPNFTLVKIDLPGHGKSPILSDKQTMEQMADAVLETLKKLEIPKYHILGHSMGGYVSLALAEKNPEVLQSLTLFFSTALEDDEEKKQIRHRSIEIIDKFYSMFVNNSIPNLFSPNDRETLSNEIEIAKNIAMETNTEGVKASQLGMIERPNRISVLENFKEKILIISGRHDGAVKNDAFFQQLPEKKNIKIYSLDCGHNGHWEKPEICSAIMNTELLDF